MGDVIPITSAKPRKRRKLNGNGEVVGIWEGIGDLGKTWTLVAGVVAGLRERVQIAREFNLNHNITAIVYGSLFDALRRLEFYTWCVNSAASSEPKRSQ